MALNWDCQQPRAAPRLAGLRAPAHTACLPCRPAPPDHRPACTVALPLQESPCGHFMHSHCFAAYTRYSYTCPVCFKSLGDMSVYWKMIDSLLAAGELVAGSWLAVARGGRGGDAAASTQPL